MSRNASIPVLFGAAEIGVRIGALARDIRALLGPEFSVVTLLKGGFVFTADLIRALYTEGCILEIDFLTLSSYGEGVESTGVVDMKKPLEDDLRGKKILLVDDILESGRTLAMARDLIMRSGAQSVHICVLLEKPGKRNAPVEADFIGFAIPDKFVVGFGLDFAHRYRELPYIGVVQGEN